MVTEKDVVKFGEQCANIFAQVSRDVIGQKEVVEGTIIAMIAGGNVLLEGVPGVGKTRLVRSLGRVFDLPFKRIQFTPDLMPADVTGTNIIVKDASGNSTFQFQPGPIFSNIILADEINRATPKTQSALLEAMQEHTVTVMGESRKLNEPFFVLATQNPIEQDGTYPLPEAQMDRFMFKLVVPNPSLNELMEIVDMTQKTMEEVADAACTGGGAVGDESDGESDTGSNGGNEIRDVSDVCDASGQRVRDGDGEEVHQSGSEPESGAGINLCCQGESVNQRQVQRSVQRYKRAGVSGTETQNKDELRSDSGESYAGQRDREDIGRDSEDGEIRRRMGEKDENISFGRQVFQSAGDVGVESKEQPCGIFRR